jgi:hypothetical protein
MVLSSVREGRYFPELVRIGPNGFELLLCKEVHQSISNTLTYFNAVASSDMRSGNPVKQHNFHLVLTMPLIDLSCRSLEAYRQARVICKAGTEENWVHCTPELVVHRRTCPRLACNSIYCVF